MLDNRTDLAKLRVDSSKGTLRKESGKLKTNTYIILQEC